MKTKQMFFDANGSFGNGARFNPNYNSAADLLAHMDRLGISKSLVWNIAARDYNAMWGNKRLMEDIKAAGAGDRLIPAFAVSPVMLYEKGTMDELIKEMESNQIRAIRISPNIIGHSIKQIEPVIREIQRFKPVLFFDCWESLQTNELSDLSAKFPDIPMVLMQGMWIHLLTILDLMWRRDNIFIDTSWLHTPHTIEMIIQKFGANRMVFGTGYKSHNGASVAALLHADITESDRELIAHKNLEALLGLPESTSKDCCFIEKAAGQDSLWDRLVSGSDIGVDIIDAHAHLGPSSSSIIEQPDIETQVEYLIPIMDKCNIKTMIVSGEHAMHTDSLEGSISLEESLQPYKGRFLGYLSFNPIYGDKLIPQLDDFFSRDFYIGFKLHNDSWGVPVTDSRFEPVWEYANKHRLPILLHTWQGNNDSPAMLKDIVPKYPEAIFILGHSGGGEKGRHEAEELAIENKNVYLEFCGSFTTYVPFEESIEKVGNDRVIFGTDAMFHGTVWELGRALSMNIPDETLIPMLGENMRKIIARRK